MVKLSLIILIVFLGNIHLEAQNNTVYVKGAEGEYYIHKDISLAEAKERALLEAKLDALRKGGIPEVFSSFESVFSTSSGQEYVEFTNVELNGGISDFKVVYDKIEERPQGHFAKIRINATILQYNKTRDPDYRVEISGISPSYMEGQLLTFKVNTSKEGYLKVFFLEENNQAELLYPNRIETNRLITEGKNILFPSNSSINYRITKQTNKVSERNTLIFVLTKSDIPFKALVTDYHSVLNWIAGINPDQRAEKYIMYTVYRQTSH